MYKIYRTRAQGGGCFPGIHPPERSPKMLTRARGPRPRPVGATRHSECPPGPCPPKERPGPSQRFTLSPKRLAVSPKRVVRKPFPQIPPQYLGSSALARALCQAPPRLIIPTLFPLPRPTVGIIVERKCNEMKCALSHRGGGREGGSGEEEY